MPLQIRRPRDKWPRQQGHGGCRLVGQLAGRQQTGGRQIKRTLISLGSLCHSDVFLLPNWLASVCLAAIFQFKGETPWVTGIKGPHLTGQQADVYGVVLGQRSNQHQDSQWQHGSAPVSTTAHWNVPQKIIKKFFGNNGLGDKFNPEFQTIRKQPGLISDIIL